MLKKIIFYFLIASVTGCASKSYLVDASKEETSFECDGFVQMSQFRIENGKSNIVKQSGRFYLKTYLTFVDRNNDNSLMCESWYVSNQGFAKEEFTIFGGYANDSMYFCHQEEKPSNVFTWNKVARVDRYTGRGVSSSVSTLCIAGNSCDMSSTQFEGNCKKIGSRPIAVIQERKF